ncbi:hypothetical protein [Acidianus bottle-shaped virus]|uniref:Uncharacterized protein ORF54 n=1 Tax=Acidianus bottle-shaped virus (isolate Italy/Pozzuoli) TaxID=654911 RepID=Y054_ABVP|nr:hypothetical protein ABV_gp40 [Acidianus bottle-shaped virus]A4ZUC6.1 RecName: Full=Uncharacterized protein ORF54 [Acidianus bottle-shaped virus (isolate Pozzuoli)]ABP73430.1 hypothetical protein [Acidianus bottle-shaped virus]
MNWKTILIYLLIFVAGIVIGKIRINVKMNKGSCPRDLIDKYKQQLNDSESSDYL